MEAAAIATKSTPAKAPTATLVRVARVRAASSAVPVHVPPVWAVAGCEGTGPGSSGKVACLGGEDANCVVAASEAVSGPVVAPSVGDDPERASIVTARATDLLAAPVPNGARACASEAASGSRPAGSFARHLMSHGGRRERVLPRDRRQRDGPATW